MNLQETTKALNIFGEAVVYDAKQNLKNSDKVASGKLLNSVGTSGAKLTGKSLQLNINLESYGAFIDKGVSGVNVKYNTPYSYTNKMPPPSALDGWIVRRGLAPRQNGKFTGRTISAVGFKESIQFLVARSIFFNGIKPSYFLSDAVKKNISKLPTELTKAFALDLDSTINFIIKSNVKK
jgi:hypothetical protein